MEGPGSGSDAAIRWGILGIGNIAGSFATGLRETPGAELVAAASRSAERVQAFAGTYNVARAYSNYEDLIADPEVDIIYVASRHPEHAEHALACLKGGKAVLLEKPFTMNAGQAAAVIDEARNRDLFLMEAMWSRFFPAMEKARALLREGAIGQPILLQADFGFNAEFDATSRIFDPQKGGGALLDIWVYPISLASMIFGPPLEIQSVTEIGVTGVDEQFALSLKYSGGRMASLMCSVRARTSHRACVWGSGGILEFEPRWWIPGTLTLHRNDQEPETIRLPHTGNGYCHEAQEAMRCFRSGLRESPVMPLSETLQIMETLDAIRKSWNLTYPADSED